jgi:PAS domain-containing protein
LIVAISQQADLHRPHGESSPVSRHGSVAFPHHPSHRDRDRAHRVAGLDNEIGKHPGSQLVLRIVNLRANQNSTGDRIDGRSDGALNAAQLGSWQYDPLHRVVSGDTRLREIFDVTDDETAIDEIVKRVHQGDMGKVRAAFDAALDPADPKPLAIVYRVQQEDSGFRWMETHALADFEGAGRERRAARVIGTVADITERKENAEKAHLLTREINIVPRTCSASWTRSPTKSPSVIPKISLGASQSASRRLQPIWTFLSGTNGRG